MLASIKTENLIRPCACRVARWASGSTLLILAGALIFFGCAQNFGRYQLSDEVRQAFESDRALPDYKYYYTGSRDRPDAILGVHRDYTLDNDFWSEIDLTGAQLKAWGGRLASAGPSRPMAYGYYILDPAGRRVGTWYSRFGGVPVKMEADNRVVVYDLIEQRPPSGGDGN